MARGTGFASCRLVRSPARGSRLAKMNCPGHRPAPSAVFRRTRDYCFALTRTAGGESFGSVEGAGSNGPRQTGRLTLHRKVAVYCRCQHRRARVSHRTGLPRRPRAWCGRGKDGRVSPRSRTVPAGSPRHGVLQCAAKRSTRFSGRRSRRMVSNDEHGGKGRIRTCVDVRAYMPIPAGLEPTLG